MYQVLQRRHLVGAVVGIVLLSLLGGLPVVVAQQEETEPNDSRENAQQIDTGEEITGELPEGDRDWFAVTVEKGETINVSAATTEGDTATQFGLLDPNGNGLAGTRLSGGTDFFGVTATTGGTYYIQTAGVSPSKGGMAYTFTVETYETGDSEPNEERANATDITVGQEVSGDVSVGDRDWYAFTVDAGETITVSAAASAEAGRSTQFGLHAPNGDGVAGARLNGGRGTFGTTAVTSGTYYIQTVGVSPSRGGGEYNVTVETDRTDYFEPNEDRGNATRLYENPLPGDQARVTLNDQDWFAFTVEEGATINVSATDAGGDRATQFGLFTPEGDNVGGERLNGATGTFGTTADTGGTYYLQTKGVSPSRGSGEYNFTVELPGRTLGLPNDRFELGNPPIGNQNRENAPTVSSGTYSLAIVDDDRDVLAVDLAEGERVRTTIDFAHEENDLALALTDASGEAVTRSDTDTDGEQVAFTAPTGGTYYLQVSGEDGAATTYEMDLAVLERTDVTLGPGGLTAPPDTTATVNVSVTDASAGLSTANLSLRSSNTSVLRIQSIDAVGDGAVSTTVADNGGAATANITDLDRSASGTVRIAEVTVAAVGNGSATLGGDASVAARPAFEYPLGSVQGTAVTVAAGEEVSTSTRSSSDGDGAAGDGGAGDGGDGAGDGADGSDGAGDGATTSGGGPGFGVVASLLALILTALLARKR